MSNRLMRKLDRMGRRRFLKTLGGLGLSATTLNYITKNALAQATSDPTKEVPYVELLRHTNPEEIKQGKLPKREPIWNTIPYAKWVRVEAAHDGAKKINNLLSQHFNSHWIAAGVTSRNGDSYQKEIAVDYSIIKHADGTISSPSVPFSEVEAVLPNSVSGQAGQGRNAETIQDIPVIVRKRSQVEASCPGNVYNEDQGDMIPGGTRIGDSGSTGTTGTAATRDSDSLNVIVSAGHVLDVSSGHLHQPGDAVSDEDLDVVNYDNSSSNDHGYAKAYDSETSYRRLASDAGGWKGTEIKGVVPWDTLKNHEGDTNYEMRKQGNRSGTTKGYITNTKLNDGVKNVWTNCDGAAGDSGSPIYRRTDFNGNDETYIAAILAWAKDNPDGECPSNKSGGNAMEYIENQMGLTV